MPVPIAALASRLTSLLERVDRAARKGGRSLSDVTLVAVTKTVPPPLIREAWRLGVRCFGENRVQEAAAKRPDLAGLDGAAWHLIGHLQTNKAGKAVELFDAVQSVDSERLADALDRAAEKAGKTLPCLVEVKTSPEPEKQGLPPEGLGAFLLKAAAWPRLKFEGLMTVAPYAEDPAGARPFFRRLRELGETHKNFFGPRLRLSMGMSQDFEAAVEEGATMIRIGAALFGGAGVTGFSVAVLGGGNMGRALVAGMLKAKLLPPARLRVTDVQPDALKALKARYKVAVGADNRAAAGGASVVLLCLKPQQMAGALEGLKGAVGPQQLVISVAAGIRTDFIEGRLGGDVPVIRTMPNTPALYGAGAVAYSPGRAATAAHEKTAVKILSALGRVWKLPEEHLDAVTALSGSGPAYVFLLAEALAEAGAKLGLPPDVAEALARQTVYGAGLMLQSGSEPAGALRERVTSPGGTTAAALAVLAESGFKAIFERALSAACRRSRELSQA